MKEIISEQQHLVELDNLPKNNVLINKYFGVLMTDKAGTVLNSGFIMREKYQNGNYQLVAPRGMTYGNIFGYIKNDLKTLIADIINTADYKHRVFMFDTPNELFNWLAKQVN